jgi:hypothetical protein
VVSATDPYGRIHGFLDRSRYFFFQVVPQLYSRGWVDHVPGSLQCGLHYTNTKYPIRQLGLSSSTFLCIEQISFPSSFIFLLFTSSVYKHNVNLLKLCIEIHELCSWGKNFNLCPIFKGSSLYYFLYSMYVNFN